MTTQHIYIPLQSRHELGAQTMMTVTELFRAANLSPSGPVPWKERVPDCKEAGVYVVARTNDATIGCTASELPFRDPPQDIGIDLDYERQRWLRDEPIVYIGQTTGQTIRERVGQFYRQKLGISPSGEVGMGSHHGGQVILLLTCPLWVYWSPSDIPENAEKMMLSAFMKKTGNHPFANFWNRRGRLRQRKR